MRRRSKIRAAVVYDAFLPRDAKTSRLEVANVAEDARQVQQALVSSGIEAVLLPVDADIFETITAIKKIKPSVIVNLCESFRDHSAYEAPMAGLLELCGCPFTGNSSSTLSLCQDKFRAKAVLRACGLRVPEGWLASAEKDIPEEAGFPLMVKPGFEDGGIGIYAASVVHDRKALVKRVNRVVKKYNQPALIEKFIAGREFNVAVIESPAIKVLPLLEISFADLPRDLPRVVGYEAKWIKNHPFYKGTVAVCPAKDVPQKMAASLRKLALQTWQVMRLSGYARIDVRVAAGSKPYILDVNPNPDASPEASGLAYSLAAEGISLSEFWHGQVISAIKRP